MRIQTVEAAATGVAARSWRAAPARTAARSLAGLGGGALVLAAMIGCSSSDGGDPTGGASDPGAEKTVLRIPLYPYIPDAAGDLLDGMSRRIEAEFEEAHPDVDLVVNPPCFVDDVYDPAALARGLSGQDPDCPYEMAEVDAILLGELVATGAIRPWQDLPQGVTWHPAGVASATVEGETYGVPHWLCGHFIFSRDEAVQSAGTIAELVAALEGLRSPRPDMAVNLLGSWNLPPIYLDAWADTHGPEGVDAAVSATTMDQATLDGLAKFAKTCESAGANPCLDGTYDLPENLDLPGQLFATDQVDAVFGFSERLHVILKNTPPGGSRSDVRISSAPLGEGSHPLIFTDVFVVSSDCTGACADAAVAFVEYMSAASTFEWILASEDAPAEGRVPRYLLAASLDAYATPKLGQDPYYATLDALTRDGTRFPNAGLLASKDAMVEAILAALEAAP